MPQPLVVHGGLAEKRLREQQQLQQQQLRQKEQEHLRWCLDISAHMAEQVVSELLEPKTDDLERLYESDWNAAAQQPEEEPTLETVLIGDEVGSFSSELELAQEDFGPAYCPREHAGRS